MSSFPTGSPRSALLSPFRRLVLGLILLAACIVTPDAPAHADSVARMKQRIASLVRAQQRCGGTMGLYVKALDTGRVVYAYRADAPLIPASNFKVLTTAVGLAALGPDFRFHTQVLAPPADAVTGVINGNVYLKGNGDPTFVEPWTRPATGPLLDFADAMYKRGVRKVTGHVVGDDSAFDREFIGRGWFQRYLLCDYAPETGALSINGNVMHLVVRPQGIEAWPPTSLLNVRRISSRGQTSVSRQYDSSNIVVRNLKQPVQTTMTLHNPPLYTTTTFRIILGKRGIPTAGARLVEDKETPLPEGLIVYGEKWSVPLLAILKRINKQSDNLFAQHVFKALGWKVHGKGTLANSARAIRDFLDGLGVDTRGLQVADGCGLSVLNHVTARQFVELLEGMNRRPDARVFKSTLSIAGKDGTLRGRMTGLRVAGKTGTIDGACTLSGYVITHAGQEVAFSILVNHHRTSNDQVRWFQDEVVKAVAASSERL